MNCSSNTLLDGPNGTFDFTNVIIFRGDVELDGGKIVGETCEFVVTMDIRDGKTATAIKLDDKQKFLKDGTFEPSKEQSNSTETHVAGNGGEENVAVDIKEVNAKGDVLVML